MRKFLCNDCGVDVLVSGDWYMATAKVWEKQLGLGWNDNLCIKCLEKRLGRKVKFPRDIVPVVVALNSVATLNSVAPRKLSARLIEIFGVRRNK
jgi:hypothetical protein